MPRLPLGSFCCFALLGSASAQQTPTPQPATVFRNVRVFDGKGPALRPSTTVVVRGNRIASIGGTAEVPADATVVEGGGRTLMPGLIDAHTHVAQATVPLAKLLTGDSNYAVLLAGKAAEGLLMQGFTSVRDVGGPTFGLKQAIDEGVVPGPRMWVAGAPISQTSGHADYRSLQDLPHRGGDPLHFTERAGAAAIADGPDEVMRRTREQLMRGASHIKLMAGGGVASLYDPLDVTQYTETEIRAAVEAADAWGTYVTVHAYTPKAIQTAIRAGVRCIEHGQLMNEETAQAMAAKGIWASLQPFLDDSDAIPFPEGSASRMKQLQMVKGTERAYALAKKYKLKTAFGTDTLFDAKLAARQGAQLAKLARWYTPSEVLKMATADNAELLAMSGLRSPYTGKLGVVEKDALADLILVDGNPIADLKLIEDPTRNFLVIMKDGKIYKNSLAGRN